ncbi:MAG: hypothetical protein ACYSSI_08710 [Planctomycetota bacterium]
MDEEQWQNAVNDLVKEFGPRPDVQFKKITALAEKARQNHEKLKKSVNKLQESLDYLRICIKYQAFDLEATRRENTYLKKLLEGQSS